MRIRRKRDLERRLTEAEERLDTLDSQLAHRDWDTLPPAHRIPRPPMPALPDYTGPGWYDDGEDDVWNPHGYL